jgi:SMODS-associating 2TM, beta-strand rich effector domain
VPARAGLYVVATLVVIGLLLGSAIHGHSPQSVSEWLAPIGPAVTAAAAGLWVFDRWVWRQPVVRNLHSRPVLHGTWHGELASSWVDPKTEKQIDPDPDVFLVVRQRFWSVSARLLTNESSSSSLFAELAEGQDGVCQLLYIYSNQPQAAFQHRSPAHFGAVVLTAPRNRADGIEGQYFTGRGTKGDLRFRVRYSALIESHDAGRALRANVSE